MAIMFITHDLGVIAEMCDEVAVMYLGKQVERADVDSIFYDPQHPYTQALVAVDPADRAQVAGAAGVDQGHGAGPVLDSDGLPVPSAVREVMAGVCDADVELPWVEMRPGHWVRCWLYGDKVKKG